MAALIAARAVQGAAAAMIAPASLSILTTRFRDGAARIRVLGYYGIMSSVGFVAGLVLGGILVEAAGWRAVFFVNVPVCLLGAAVGRRAVPPDAPSPAPPHLDLIGAGLVTAGVASLVYAPTAGVDDGWTSPALFLALAAAGVLSASFVWREQRARSPLMPLSIFRSRTLVVGDGVSFLVGAWNAAEVLILSLFCQQVLGYSPLITGLVVVPQGVAGLLRGLVGPTFVARLGIKRFLAMSAAITSVGLALLLRFPATSHYPLLGVVLLIAGFGTTVSVFASTIAGTAGVSDDERDSPAPSSTPPVKWARRSVSPPCSPSWLPDPLISGLHPGLGSCLPARHGRARGIAGCRVRCHPRRDPRAGLPSPP